MANLQYSPRYDGYFVTMDIFGNKADEQKPVTFRAYDASTGTLYPEVNPSVTITYAPLGLEGSYAAPVALSTANKIEQSNDLKKGWNWLSLYVVTDDMSPDAVFAKIAGDVIQLKSHNGFTENNGNGGFTEGISTIENGKMYAVQVSQDCTLRLVGTRASGSISLVEGWNWIGTGQKLTSVGEALANMEPANGDILKGLQGVTYFDTYEWAGSLQTMQPGMGYKLKSAKDVTFIYPNTVTGAAASRMVNGQSSMVNGQSSLFTPGDYHLFADNMTMTALVVLNGDVLTDAEIGVFVNDDECRATATTNKSGRAYLTIPGDEECTLTFLVAAGGKVYQAIETVGYAVDAICGSYGNPFVIHLGDATGISNLKGTMNDDYSVYDLQGRKVSTGDNANSKLRKGVYVVNGQKKVMK